MEMLQFARVGLSYLTNPKPYTLDLFFCFFCMYLKTDSHVTKMPEFARVRPPECL